jgi:hypothetical protein
VGNLKEVGYLWMLLERRGICVVEWFRCTGNFLDVGFNFGAKRLIGVRSSTGPNYSTRGSLIGSIEGLKWLHTISDTVGLGWTWGRSTTCKLSYLYGIDELKCHPESNLPV